MEANEIHRCCHGQQQQHQQQQAVEPETDPSATVEAAETNEVTLQLGKRPIVFDKMESLVREMQDPENGVPIRSQKLFLTSIPSAFMGYDMIEWLMERLNIEDSVEAIHMANLLCQHGYFFPVGECNKNLAVKDDSSLYRFQAPDYWPSQNHNPENSEYVIYLYKRSLRNKQKHGLEEYELEALARLKKQMANKWEFIVMQAEEQVKMAKDRKKGDKIVTDSQERAYWRAYRPPPSFLNCLEQPPYPKSAHSDMTASTSNPIKRWRNIEGLKAEVEFVRSQLIRARIKVSVAAETLQQHCSTYSEYDPFLTPPQPSNPWLSDDQTYWILNAPSVEVPTEKRAKRWAISIEDLVADQTGLQELTNYLRKEYSHENIRFWLATNQLRSGPASRILHRVHEIYQEFLAPGAPCEINIDGRTMDLVQHEMKRPSRFTFDRAAEHVYNLLLKKDCYPRFVRSDHYKQLLANALQPSHKKRFFSFGATGKKKSIVAANTVGVTGLGLPVGTIHQQLNLSCGAAVRRRNSIGDRSLSGSPPDPQQPVAVTTTSLLLASSSATTAAASAGINSAQANTSTGSSSTPGDDCDTPYRGDMPPSQRVAPIVQLVSPVAAPNVTPPPPTLQPSGCSGDSPPATSSRPSEREDDVCPWESMSPPSSKCSRMKSVLLAPSSTSELESSVSLASPAKTGSLSCSVDSHPSTDLDVCPWDSVAVVLPSTGSSGATRSRTPVLQPKGSTEVPEDVVCPWESQASTSQDVTVTPALHHQSTLPAGMAIVRHQPETQTGGLKASSEVTVITLNPMKPSVSPVISPAGGSTCSCSSGDHPKESASGVTLVPESDPQQQPPLDKSSAKISDICPWEDEESCKLDQPFVKTYATLGYL